MTAKQYEIISAPFRTPGRTKALKTANILITAIGYAAYPLMLMYLYFMQIQTIIPAIAVPAVGFCLLTVIRRKINRLRPYQTLDIKPLIHKDKQGKSMPSRHVFSMTIIAVTGFIISPVLGAFLMVLSFMLAAIRAIGGVHYPSDVIVGIISAIIWGSLWYSILL